MQQVVNISSPAILVNLQRIYNVRGVPVRYFTSRDGEFINHFGYDYDLHCCLPSKAPMSNLGTCTKGSGKIGYRVSHLNAIDIKVLIRSSAEINGRMIREWTPPAERIRAAMECMIRLDSILNPGLQLHQFVRLFAICRQCRRVMTRRVVLVHECIAADVPEDREDRIIDLTEDD